MTTTRTATVINGALQLDEPLHLPEESRVTVTVSNEAQGEVASASPRRPMSDFRQFVQGLQIRSGEKLTRKQLHDRS